MSRVIASLFLVACAFAGDPEWPGFRGPSSNPSAVNSDLPDKWSKSSNIEWTATLPGLGWSSPIVAGKSIFLTTVTTDGKAKQPQAGTDYSNDYVAELSKQGLKGKEVAGPPERARFRASQRSRHCIICSIRSIWTPARSTGSTSSMPATRPAAGIGRTVSVRKPRSPTASACMSTSTVSASSPTISTERKSGTRRLKASRPFSISALPLRLLS